jgi:hypothetical protein
MANLIGGLFKTIKANFVELPFNPDVRIINDNIVVYAVGPSLIHFKNSQQIEFIICGSALDENLKLMDEDSWRTHTAGNDDYSKLNGHFLLVKIHGNKIEIKNDTLGLRELFFSKQNDGIFFSTRLDWLVNLIDSPQLNFDYLCSMWNFENPLVEECLISNVKLFGRGGTAQISIEQLSITNNSWLPKKQENTVEDIVEMISCLIQSLLKNGKKYLLDYQVELIQEHFYHYFYSSIVRNGIPKLLDR